MPKGGRKQTTTTERKRENEEDSEQPERGRMFHKVKNFFVIRLDSSPSPSHFCSLSETGWRVGSSRYLTARARCSFQKLSPLFFRSFSFHFFASGKKRKKGMSSYRVGIGDGILIEVRFVSAATQFRHCPFKKAWRATFRVLLCDHPFSELYKFNGESSIPFLRAQRPFCIYMLSRNIRKEN